MPEEKMTKFLQIAPHSLAVVLSPPPPAPRVVPAAGEEMQHRATGYEVFADFKAENMQHFWNKRVTDAVAEVFFLGWIDMHVLLIQGKETHLEVLREAWMRRSLKPPRNFSIKYLGNVSSISMSPISQSQFIPLGEILCLAISAMNASRKPVTHEALMEHLAICFPGVPAPSQEILCHTLNLLVRERKVYPTPDGYFIVTPQTYFITPSLIRTNSKWYHLDERIPERSRCTSPRPGTGTATVTGTGTVTPANSGCPRERGHPHRNHCDSCNCFREGVHQHQPPSTLLRKAGKDSHCPPSLLQPPSASQTEKSKAVVNSSYKAETLVKPRDSGGGGGGDKQPKRFGLKLFRLSFKKDKSRQLANFSAQFPPEEWPLRDEDNPSAIPREVEQEIIRRVNPGLTLENVAKHTALMKKLEEDKCHHHHNQRHHHHQHQRSQQQPGSSAQHSGKSRRSRGHKKRPHGRPRSHSKSEAPHQGEDGEGEEAPSVDDEPPAGSGREAESFHDHGFVAYDRLAAAEPRYPAAPEWDVSADLYKRRTESQQIQEDLHHHHLHQHHHHRQPKVHRSHSHTQDRQSRNDRAATKAKKGRSRSMDNSNRALATANSANTATSVLTEEGQGQGGEADVGQSASLGLAGLASHPKDIIEPGLPEGGDHRHGPTPAGESPPHLHHRDPSSHPSKDSGRTAPPPAPSPLAKGRDDQQSPLFKDCHALTLSDGFTTLSPPERLSKQPAVEDKANGQPEHLSLLPEHCPDGHHANMAATGQAPPALANGQAFAPPRETVNHLDRSCCPESPSRKPQRNEPSAVFHTNCEVLGEGLADPVPPRPRPTPAPAPPAHPESSFDYYNVSEDEDDEEEDEEEAEDSVHGGKAACSKGQQVEGKRREEGSTVQWLLEREKDKGLQRRFEKHLTLLSPRESEGQKASHSARLDSMDSSSITVDSGFNSPRYKRALST
ncbi:storkhead-box protein 2-like isoform X2 [Rhinoraja longicauda]